MDPRVLSEAKSYTDTQFQGFLDQANIFSASFGGFYETEEALKAAATAADFDKTQFYGVGTEVPFQVYLYNTAQGDWTSVGTLGKEGPQGEKGEVGAVGPQGQRGSTWFNGLLISFLEGDANNTIDHSYWAQSYENSAMEGDFYLNTKTFVIYKCIGTNESNSKWEYIATLKGMPLQLAASTASIKTDTENTNSRVSIDTEVADDTCSFAFTFYNLKGEKGDKGTAGKDGVSPTVKVEQTNSGATIAITDGKGTATATINNGAQGPQGPQGESGVYVGIDQPPEGTKVWVNPEGTAAGETPILSVFDDNNNQINIPAIKGEIGPAPIVTGTKTNDGTELYCGGQKIATIYNGAKGENGKDGISPSVAVNKIGATTVLSVNGQSVMINDGAAGTNGTNGQNASVSIGTVTVEDGTGAPNVVVNNMGTAQDAKLNFVFSGIKGETGAQGEKGKPGNGLTILGIKATTDDLSSITSPKQGDAYLVGEAEPYTTYMWNADGTTEAWVNLGFINGVKGDKGEDGTNGTNGKDGVSPHIEDGYWWIGTQKTETRAQGEKGEAGKDGTSAFASVTPITTTEGVVTGAQITISDANGTTTAEVLNGEKGESGHSPSIDTIQSGTTTVIRADQQEIGRIEAPYIKNGYWCVNGENTNISAQGPTGEAGPSGQDGQDGATPIIGENGNWYINGVDTGTSARGISGADGNTPYINENGYWCIGNTITETLAEGTIVTVNGKNADNNNNITIEIPTSLSQLANDSGYLRAPITRESLDYDANCGPIQGITTANRAITIDDVGTTLVAGMQIITSNGTQEIAATAGTMDCSEMDFLFTVEGAMSGNYFETAIFNYNSKTTKIKFSSSCKVLMLGQNGPLSAPTLSVEKYGMAAVKKIVTNVWLVTGNVEVDS